MTPRPRYLVPVLVLFALSVALMIASVASGAPRWEPVRNAVQGSPSSAASDGSGALLVTPIQDRLILTTVTGTRASARNLFRETRIQDGPGPVVLTTPGGSAAVIYEDIIDRQYQIRASLRGSRTSGWTAPRTLSLYPAAGFGRVYSASVAPDGTMLVAWWGGPAGGQLGIYARTWKLGSGWSPVVEVSRGTFPQSAAFRYVSVGAAAGPNGHLAVAWQSGTGAGSRILVARRPAGTDWAAPVEVANANLKTVPTGRLPVAVDGAGRATTAWTEYSTPPLGELSERTSLHAAVVAAGAPERQEVRCAAGELASVARVAADADGNLMAAWQLGRFSPNLAEVQLAARPAGASSWTVPAPVVPESRGYTTPQALQAIGGGRFQVVITIIEETSAADQGRTEVITVDTTGAPVDTPLGPPARPGRVSRSSDRYLPFAAGGGVLAWAKVSAFPAPSGVAILRP